MSRKNHLRQLGRTVPAPVWNADPPDVPTNTEPDQLARELVRAFTEQIKMYRRGQGLDSDGIDPSQPPPEGFVETLRTKLPEDVRFFDLERLRQMDPALVLAHWEELKAVARRDLDSGWLAARNLEALGGNAWDRACFAAVRTRLVQAWQPRHPGEAILVDQMAQYEMLRQRWLYALSMNSWGPTMRAGRHEQLKANERCLSWAQSTEEAMRMVERLQRLYLTAQRALLSLRRGRGALIVHGSGPLNIAVGQQLNVNAPTTDGDGEP